MKLYLVRHGHALDDDVDAKRPLSPAGLAEVERAAAFLKEAGVRVAQVLHSGKTRAKQTAELLADAVGAGGRVEPRAGLNPLDPPAPIAASAARWTEDAMLVGHLPFMPKLASHLLMGRGAAPFAAFATATIVCLERLEDDRWSMVWMLPPELTFARGKGEDRR